jgi:hypothetical protein
VEIHVLGVPGKARLPAAKVEVGRVHAADLDPVVLINIKKPGIRKQRLESGIRAFFGFLDQFISRRADIPQ